MARKPRMYLPEVPAHVVQRGNNRGACFFSDDDYLLYLDRLGEGLKRYGVRLHAYVLMTNHVHLLMTPEKESSISRLMQHVGRHYVLYVNKNYRRTGTLWEGRHKASLVQAEDYLLTSYRYIEMNPVAAGMVEAPDVYRWSSYRWHAWGEKNVLISDHPLYEALGVTSDERQRAYRELFRYQIPEVDVHEIRTSLQCNFPLGNNRFRQEVERCWGDVLDKQAAAGPGRSEASSQITTAPSRGALQNIGSFLGHHQTLRVTSPEFPAGRDCWQRMKGANVASSG